MRTLIVAYSLTLVACAHTDSSVPQQPAAARLVASLERTECYGTCPIYKVSLFSDGTIKYDGKRFVKNTGTATAQSGTSTLSELAKAFAHARFFELADTYERLDVTDHPSAIVFFDDSTRHKTVSHYHGDRSAPESLRKLEDEIDRVLGSERFIGTAEERRKIPSP
jgi:hypothetical protein